MSSMTRREFIESAVAACACSLCAVAGAQNPAVTGPINAGPASKYASPGVWDEFAKTSGFLLVSDKGKIYAISANCTHKRGVILKDSAAPGQLKCTKHDGKFNISGVPTGGPPK